MTDLIMPRRGFLRGLGSLIIAAPAIVHASNLMPVKSLPHEVVFRTSVPVDAWRDLERDLYAYIDGLSQRVHHSIMYGNAEADPVQFVGFSPFKVAPHDPS